ncbi:ABC transporter ATP-binding protein [Ruminococcaceae bacterium OttesenSCG-928-L11]|nr:ABC transporter ATP-binding protein [Ruminococcaceae bacterium OttesenSCG-928-L11]
MSVSISFQNIVKKYGDNTIIPNLSLKIRDGEFFTLLGPSGCGKTTLLRMIIGFNSIEGGQISFDDSVVNDVPPSKRNIGMVFQNYAIFPHMTVGENVAFGLKNRKVPKAEIQQRVDEILKVVRIDNLKDRLPQNMSGGQQQRVALARAIVIHPQVLLMDEPLSNLDAKLRVEMRDAIRDIQHRVGITTVYVTHDQEEALAISDRIGVMNGGVLQHVGTPQNIYQRPANIFVSTFIGHSNILDLHLADRDGKRGVLFDGGHFVPMDNLTDRASGNQQVKVSIRPEEFIVSTDGEGLEGEVVDSIFLGLHTHSYIRLLNGTVVETVSESRINTLLPAGTKVRLQVKAEKINVFTADGNTNLVQGVVNDAV